MRERAIRLSGRDGANLSTHARPLTHSLWCVAPQSEGWNPGLHDYVAFYAADPHGFLIALIDGTPVGCISAVRCDAAPDPARFAPAAFLALCVATGTLVLTLGLTE